MPSAATSNALRLAGAIVTTAAFRASHDFQSRSGSGSCAGGKPPRSHGSTSASNLLAQCMTGVGSCASSPAPGRYLWAMERPCQPSLAMKSEDKGQQRECFFNYAMAEDQIWQ